MEKNVIATTAAPGAIGPYSQARLMGDLLITSGQIPLDPATGVFPEGIEAQTELGFYVLVRTYSVLFRIGAAIELQRLGYTIKRVM